MLGFPGMGPYYEEIFAAERKRRQRARAVMWVLALCWSALGVGALGVRLAGWW